MSPGGKCGILCITERVMDMTVMERLAALRRKMKENSCDACLIVTDDFHGSEYVGEHFKTRAFFSGFTGSAGTLLVLAEEAYLWTDGRYFLQAAQQLRGSGVGSSGTAPGMLSTPIRGTRR